MRFNKACEIEDFTDAELVEVMRDVCAYKVDELPGFPKGTEHRKDWEVAMAVRALRHFGALRPDAVVLGVAAGTEDTLFYLTRHARQVFATDRYLAPGDWGPTAPVSMLLDPSALAPDDFDPNRLVVQHMDARLLRYPADTFDGVFSSGSIEHVGELADVASAAYEMGRVLKPGGVLSLSTELLLDGPAGGIGWPGMTLIISAENLRRYIVEASGLEPVDDLVPVVSEETLATRRQLSGALADHLARVEASGGAPSARFTEWDFPHVLLEHGPYTFTSVHLTLRKTDSYPAVDNSWAAPSPALVAAVRDYDRSLLSPKGGDPPGPPAPAAEAGSARATPAPSARRATGGGAVSRLGASGEVDTRITEIDALRADLDRPLVQVESLQATVGAALEAHRREFERSGWGPPEPMPFNRTSWAAPRVTAPAGRSFVAVIDTELTDPITLTLAGGQVLDTTNVALMLELVGPGSVLLDVGAHLGQFSLSAAAAESEVLAVEASPLNAALLRASAARNGFATMSVVQAAVSDRPGTVDFVARGPWGRVALSSDEAAQTVSVPAVTLDELLAEFGASPTFVKVDVEGSEIPAFNGMAAFLSRPEAPPVLFESNGHTSRLFGSAPSELLATLERFGYASHAIEPDRLVRTLSDDFQPQTIVDYLAFKHPPAGLAGWRVDDGYDLDERVAKIVADCRFPNEDHRAYMAAALAGAGAVLLSHRSIAAALDALVDDPVDSVRAAARWWKEERP